MNMYLDPKVGFVGPEKLAKKLGVRVANVRRENKEIEIVQRYRKLITPFEYRKITGPPFSFQVDIVYMPFPGSKVKGVANKPYCLLCIDILSRYALVYPIPSRNIDEICAAFVRFTREAKMISGKAVNSVFGDDEFSAAAFVRACRNNQVAVKTFVSNVDKRAPGRKIGILDRYVRTLKGMVVRWCKSNNTHMYAAVLQDIVTNYNNTVHRSLGHTPIEVFMSAALQKEIRHKNAMHNKYVGLDQADAFIRKGDTVRYNISDISMKIKGKEGPTFSKKVDVVASREGNRFMLGTAAGEFKGLELLKTESKNAPSPRPSPVVEKAAAVAMRTRALITCLKCQKNNRQNKIITCKNKWCNVSYHFDCFGLSKMPEEWYCPLHDTACQICKKTDDADKMIICDSCEKGYHMKCINLIKVPAGTWKCSECLAKARI